MGNREANFVPDQRDPEIVQELVRIWRTVLGDDALNAESDLLDSGGTSFTALRILAYIREDLGRDVDVATILDQPTPAALAPALKYAPAWTDDDL
jgi:hypothetical protein